MDLRLLLPSDVAAFLTEGAEVACGRLVGLRGLGSARGRAARRRRRDRRLRAVPGAAAPQKQTVRRDRHADEDSPHLSLIRGSPGLVSASSSSIAANDENVL